MALALALNRTFVLPRLQCFCYKNWFANQACRLPGDRASKLPFTCTLEQWLRPKELYKGFNTTLGGRNARWVLLQVDMSHLTTPTSWSRCATNAM